VRGWNAVEEYTEAKKQLWGGEFWSDGYFVSAAGEYENEGHQII
jgi:REP element-mobilizing transposase RayT